MNKTHRLIPGGAHTYSKGDDQFPSNAPGYLERGEGCYVWDGKGNKYLDWGMGLRTVILGYGYKPVIDAAIKQIYRGSNFTRPSYIETELAERLVETIPSAEMVKFAKNGSTVTTAAIKLARTYTGRDYVAICADHPFFSYDDWFIGTTPCNSGIPRSAYAFTLKFNYNNIESLEKLFLKYPNKIAGVILEPAATEEPRDDFLRKVARLCRLNGAIFILDEMITGFRWHIGGAQAMYKVYPDMSTFGKAMGNGFSISALVGKREIMELGGLHHKKRRVFLISTTHGAENHALAAAISTIKEMKRKEVISHIWEVGGKLIKLANDLIRAYNLNEYITFYGFSCRPEFVCKDDRGKVSLEFRTLLLQEMSRRGVLMPYIAPSYAHTEKEVLFTLRMLEESLKIYRSALSNGVKRYLKGHTIKPVFREYN